MTIDTVTEARTSSTIQQWARTMGVRDSRPVDGATAKALVALRQGATSDEALAVARSHVSSWLRHPCNARRRTFSASLAVG